MLYSDYQNQVSSEKIVLAILEPSKQLVGWELHSGSVYKLTNFTFPIISSIKDSGTPYSAVGSIGAVVTSTYYLDEANQTIYLRTTGSDNPNGRFIVVTFKLFYANVPITLPHDLNTGSEVYFEPLIKSNSQFGVEIDTINQTSEAIEGSGTLTLINDQDFFIKQFDKISFENSDCNVYSYNRNLPVTEARKIFEGKIEVKKYNAKTVQFSLKDLLTELRTSVNLGTIGDLALRTSADLDSAKQRMVLGRVFGHRPVNTDSVLDGYPVTGTISIANGSATVAGAGTLFLKELSPDDQLVINGEEFTIASIASNTSLTLSESFNEGDITSVGVQVIPSSSRRHMNRTWHLAGHSLKQPATVSTAASSIIRLFVQDTTDMYPDDWIYIGNPGSGELAQIDKVQSDTLLLLKTSLASVPPAGVSVVRPCIQNVRIDSRPLVYERDYSVDPATATLTLEETAEANASSVRYLNGSLTFTNGSRVVTGGNIKVNLQVGYMVGVVGQAVYYEIMSIDSDTQLTLRTAPDFTATATGRYKPLLFNPDSSVLTADLLGRTENGLSTGILPKTAPDIAKMLLTDLGLQSKIHTLSFSQAKDLAPQHLGAVFPDTFNSNKETVYRDILNVVNKSVFGYLLQDNDFLFRYNVLYPNKSVNAKLIEESDCINFKFDSVSDKLVKTSIIQYRPREYDFLSKKSTINTKQKTSIVSTYLKKATETKTIVTKLVEESDAAIIANRWAFILENGSGKATIETKLQTIDLNVGDVIYLSHSKLFERYGTTLKARLFLIESVKKTGFGVDLEIVDLSNAFTRVCGINDLTTTYTNSSDEQRVFSGFYTDDYGLIDNNPDSYGVNLIW